VSMAWREPWSAMLYSLARTSTSSASRPVRASDCLRLYAARLPDSGCAAREPASARRSPHHGVVKRRSHRRVSR
jgi:hypothetical protein